MPGPARWWGWHQLDDRWAGRLVAAAGVRPGDLVLDIGAGTGALTRPLLEAGARVIAIELHPARAALLRQRFEGQRVKVVRADAADLRLPLRPFRVVANPPFGITTALVRRLVDRRSALVRADLILPRAAAARWASSRACGGFTGAVSGSVPRAAFRPPPPRDAALLTIERTGPARDRRP